MKQAIQTQNAPLAIGPYSQAIAAGPFLHVSGQIPVDPKEQSLVKGDITAQTERVMLNIKAILESADFTFDHAVKCTIYLQDLKNFSKVNEVYSRYFSPPFPARATIEVSALPMGADVEIELIAYKGNSVNS